VKIVEGIQDAAVVLSGAGEETHDG
jgi:hypothetical protein